jgi:hypothetical protein
MGPSRGSLQIGLCFYRLENIFSSAVSYLASFLILDNSRLAAARDNSAGVHFEGAKGSPTPAVIAKNTTRTGE